MGFKPLTALLQEREKKRRKVRKRVNRNTDFDKCKMVRMKAFADIKRDKIEEMIRKCKVFKTNKQAFYGFVRSKHKSTTSNLNLKNNN